ncbi:gas vesicle protein GvpO [Streptomyces natalensis]|nr:gas vesicle protein GvpO [Streptomyces natalensis]
MASYRVTPDEEGSLVVYERTRRYTRGQSNPDSGEDEEEGDQGKEWERVHRTRHKEPAERQERSSRRPTRQRKE